MAYSTKVNDVRVRRDLTPDGVLAMNVNWNTVVGGVTDVEKFNVYRSYAPSADFVKIDDTVLGEFLDEQAKIRTGVDYYYKTTYVSTSLGESDTDLADVAHVHSYPPSGFADRLYYVSLEQIRRITWLLANMGEACKLFVKARAGTKCPDCFDVSSDKVADSQCTTCYGTGYMGGYIKMDVNVLFRAAEERFREIDFGLTPEFQPRASIANLPVIHEGDLLTRPNNIRYTITNVQAIFSQDFLVEQDFSLTQLLLDDVVYRIP